LPRGPRSLAIVCSSSREKLRLEVETGRRLPTQPRHFDPRRQAPEAANEKQRPRPILHDQIGGRSVELDIEGEIEQHGNIFDALNRRRPYPSKDGADLAHDLPLAFDQPPMSRRIADPTLVDLDSKAAALVLEHYATAVKFGNRRSGKSIGYTRPGLNLAVVSDDKVTRVLHRRTNAGHSRLSDRLLMPAPM